MDNNFAFPVTYNQGTSDEETQSGLTKREYFTAAALTGLLASYAVDGQNLPEETIVVKWAIEYADEALKQLS